jgi:Tfp pilus assembly protein PilE
VLIIGILAAIALPQYQRGVRKAKAAQAFVVLDKAYKTINEYFLVTGTDSDISWKTIDLEIDLTGCTISTSSWTVTDGQLACPPGTAQIPIGVYSIAKNPAQSIFYDEIQYGNGSGLIDFLFGVNWRSGAHWCSSSDTNDDVCLQLGGLLQSDKTLCGTHRTKCYAM